MTGPLARQVAVFADLDVEVDGRPVKIRSGGSDVEISTSDAAGLSRHIGMAATAAGGGLLSQRRFLGRVADAANRAGIRITVVGGSGTLLIIGRGVRVRTSALIVGSAHVRVRAGRESASALLALVRR